MKDKEKRERNFKNEYYILMWVKTTSFWVEITLIDHFINGYRWKSFFPSAHNVRGTYPNLTLYGENQIILNFKGVNYNLLLLFFYVRFILYLKGFFFSFFVWKSLFYFILLIVVFLQL